MNDRETNLRDMLHRTAKWCPTKEAVVDDIDRYSYGELLAQVQRMAKLYHTLGVRKGDRVALLMYPCVQHVVALFGAFELGAIPCALHVREPNSILAAVLNRLSPRVLVYDGALDRRVRQLRDLVPLITYAVRAVSAMTPAADADASDDPVIPRDLSGYELDFETMPIAADDVAMIVLSSGTTGVPKGIIHTHRTQIESARGGAYAWGCTPYSCLVNFGTTAFIGWYNGTFPFFNAGAKVVYLSQWSPQKFLQKVQDERATIAFLAPTMWRMLFRHDVDLAGYDLSSVKKAGYSSEPMDITTMAMIRERICKEVINIYGTTETGSLSGGTMMFTEDYEDDSKLESVGKPFINADVRVIAQGGTAADVLPAGEEGEVLVRGPSVASMVWDQPEIARKIFEGPWWHSGDVGVIDRDNYLYLRGRIDDMIISGGINILPSQVEEAVLSHPSVSECVVIGLPDDKWGQQVTAFVVCRTPVSVEVLAAHVEGMDLAGYKRPREYRIVEELPRGNTGKVNRRVLREQVTKKS